MHASLSVLNLLVVKEERKIFLVSPIILITGDPEELAESTNFSISLNKMMSTNIW